MRVWVVARDPAEAFALATLRMGVAYEEMSIAFWEGVAAHPPSVPAAPSGEASDRGE